MYVTKEKEKMSAVSFSSGLYADPKVSRVAGQIMCIVIRFSRQLIKLLQTWSICDFNIVLKGQFT